MKQKFRNLVEANVMRLAKRCAAEEGRPLNELIEDALLQYLGGKRLPAREWEMAYYSGLTISMSLHPPPARSFLFGTNPWKGEGA